MLYQSSRGVSRVAACSAEAAALGAVVGMPLAEVQAVCGTMKMLPYDPPADRQALEALAAHCACFSPVVGLEQSDTPDSLLLDITGLAHLFGGEASLAERIVRDFAQRGLLVRVAIADTIGAAWAMAHYGEVRGEGGGRRAEGGTHHSSFIIPHSALPSEGRGKNGNCKLQSSFFRLPPSALRLPPSYRLPPTAYRLPIAALRLPEEVVALLRQLGIEQIGQLEALPRSELSSRFGPQLLKRLDQASGRLAEPVVACDAPPQLQAAAALEYPTIRRETIEAVLEHLLCRVAAMLIECGCGALRLECRLTCAPSTLGARPSRPPGTLWVAGKMPVLQAISVGLFEPTASAGHLFQLARMQLERLRLDSPVTAIQVEAAATAPLLPRQQELFSDGSARRHPRHLAGLIDRLRSRLGRHAVMGVRLVADAQPEKAWRSGPLVASSCSRFEDHSLPPRPLRLLPVAARLAVTSIVPDGPPLRFLLHGCCHQVARTWGPERIETGWWRGRPVGRDYYRIETTTGHRFWLFRRLDDGQWFLHGMFE